MCSTEEHSIILHCIRPYKCSLLSFQGNFSLAYIMFPILLQFYGVIWATLIADISHHISTGKVHKKNPNIKLKLKKKIKLKNSFLLSNTGYNR
jgi:hypothetical protein